MGDETVLVQFARTPALGEVKTRLVPALGEEGALALHERLVFHTCNTLVEAALGPVQLWVAGEIAHPLIERCAGLGLEGVHRQCDGNLGTRMAQALERNLVAYRRVILVGSDIPGLDRDYLQAAIRALDDCEAVLGPALDGGYVLLGLRRFSLQLMENIDWGSNRVLLQTEERLDALGWRYRRLSPLADIDRPEDLVHLPPILAQAG